jgi:glycosyltransferase involved in cell wall biosynthesis
MKVLIDARPLTIPAPGGVTRLTRSLLQALIAKPAETEYLLGTTGQQELPLGLSLPMNARRLHLAWPNKVVSTLTSSGLRSFEQFFPQQKANVLFFPNNGHVGRPRLPYGLLVHDLSFLAEPTWFNWRGQIWHQIVHAERLMQEATRLFAVSEWTKFAIQLHLDVPADRIDVLPIPRKSELTSPGNLPAIVKDKRYVLCLGRQDRRKNASCVVAAMKQLHTSSRYTDLHLVIVGGYSEALSDPRFIVLPRVDDATLSALYKSAHAFLYPSWYEGLGLPLHEAAAFGVPSIASSTTALPEAAPNNTIFAPPSKPHTWALAIEHVLTRAKASSKELISTESPFNAFSDWEQAVVPVRRFLQQY